MLGFADPVPVGPTRAVVGAATRNALLLMPITPRRGASLAAAASLLAGLVLNVVLAAGVQALPQPFGTAPAPSTDARSGAQPTASATNVATPSATPTPTPTPLAEPVAAALSRTSGGTAERAVVTMRGRAMANVAEVVVGGQDAQQLVLLSPTELRFTVPQAQDFVPGTAAISLVSATDRASITTPFRWTWAVRSGIDREMAYAVTHWSLHSSARFGYIPKNDCVNFVSQLLLARGWRESSSWWNDGPVKHTVKVKKTVVVKVRTTVLVPVKPVATPTPTPSTTATPGPVKVLKPLKHLKPSRTDPAKPAMKKVVGFVDKKVVKTVTKVVTTVDASAAWVSSTAMSAWLTSRPDLATHLSYAQRAQVRIGDVVQFDWTGAGSSWDHSAVVSKIVVQPNGSEDIWYAEHTNHQLYGGSIGALMKLPAYAHMRVQFWHLKH